MKSMPSRNQLAVDFMFCDNTLLAVQSVPTLNAKVGTRSHWTEPQPRHKINESHGVDVSTRK